MSAGISAMAGARASAESVQVMRERGLDLGQHESQPINERLVRYADVIMVMTRSHRDAILTQWPNAAPRVRLLGSNETDIVDPFGGAVEHYRRCAEQLDASLDVVLNEMDRKGLWPLSTTGA